MPQGRDTDPFHSSVLPRGKVISEKLKNLAVEMYIRGMSTRDIEEALKQDGKLLLSREGVSELTEIIAEEFEQFSQRDLSNLDVVYLFIDGIYEHCRYQAGRPEAILCGWGILSNGRKVLIHLGMGNKESYKCWQEFFRSMIKRGLRQPLLATADGAPGLIKAVEECFPGTKRQRCLFHKMQNIVNKLPENAKREIMSKVRAVFDQTNKEVAKIGVQKLIEEYADEYPSAMKCFQDDLEACLAFMEFPAGHHKSIRTTNLIERAFEEHRRRSKVIPRFMTEKSCLKLIFATLIRVSEKWRRVEMTEYDLTLLT
jgi:transposase-like protein